MVYPALCRRSHCGSNGATRPCLPGRRREEEQGIASRASGAQPRKVADRATKPVWHLSLLSTLRLRYGASNSLIVVHFGSTHVDGYLGAWRRRSLSARYDRDDRGPEGIGWLRAAHGAQPGGSDAAARLLLGRRGYAPGAVIRCHDDDDYRSRQRRLVDVSAGIGPRLRCECRHDGHRLARRTYRCPSLAHSCCTADDIRWRPDQAPDKRAPVRGRCVAGRIWAGAFWT